MNSRIVFTVLSKDKPGILTTISSVIKKHQGNWLNSHFSQLAGEFAGIICIEFPKENKQSITQSLKDLSKQDIAIQISNHSIEKDSDKKEISIEIIGNDRLGLVTEISSCFSESGINITQLETFITDAAMSGGQLFHANAVIELGKGSSQEKLQDKLYLLSEKLSLDIEWTTSI